MGKVLAYLQTLDFFVRCVFTIEKIAILARFTKPYWHQLLISLPPSYSLIYLQFSEMGFFHEQNLMYSKPN